MSAESAWSENQSEIRELRAEIERLKAENARLKQLNLMTDEQVVMDLKAEIERLREAEPSTVVSADGKSFMDAPAPPAREAEDKDKLITELADTLYEWANLHGHLGDLELVQRAWEATR